MARLTPKDGFSLHGWMVTDLHLSGGELIAFALVHQFAKSKKGAYTGGVAYLCEWTGWSYDFAARAFHKLEEYGLLIPERRPGKTTIYRVNASRSQRVPPPAASGNTSRSQRVHLPLPAGGNNKDIKEYNGKLSRHAAERLALIGK